MFPTRHRTRAAGGAPDAAWRPEAAAFAVAIYLVAWVAPGLGATVAWLGGWAWTGDRALARHYRRALAIQVACLGAMLAIQAGVVGVLASGFPWIGPAALRYVVVVAGLHLTVGVHLVMGLLGPILLLAERRGAAGPVRRLAPRAPAPTPRPAPGAGPRTRVAEVTTRRFGAAGGVVSAG